MQRFCRLYSIFDTSATLIATKITQTLQKPYFCLYRNVDNTKIALKYGSIRQSNQYKRKT